MKPIKELIQGEVTFEFYRDGNLYYRTGDGSLLFPVPINDTGNATFKAKEGKPIPAYCCKKGFETAMKKVEK